MVRIERYMLGWNHNTQAAEVQLLLEGNQTTVFQPRDAAELAAVATILATGRAGLTEDGTIVTIWI